METEKTKLTVLFDPPFWTGVFERESGGRYAACRVVFGAEPRDCEIYGFILDRYCHLTFSPSLGVETEPESRRNPKRVERLARQQTRPTGTGTKAQQALQLQQEQRKKERQILLRDTREAEEKRRFLLRREKRKKKHRGH